MLCLHCLCLLQIFIAHSYCLHHSLSPSLALHCQQGIGLPKAVVLYGFHKHTPYIIYYFHLYAATLYLSLEPHNSAPALFQRPELPQGGPRQRLG